VAILGQVRNIFRFAIVAVLTTPSRRSLRVPAIMHISPSQYPLARRDESVIDDYHGQKVADPYRWLEDPDATETQDFVSKLNSISRPFLDACNLKPQINKKLTELWDFGKFTCPSRQGDNYFYSYNSGLQNQFVLKIASSPQDEGRDFLDPNKLSEDGTTALTSKAFSDDGSLLAYGLAEKGSDWTTIKFKKVPSGEDLPDVLRKVKFSVTAWTHDNKGVFYNMYPQLERNDGTVTEKNQFHSLYYHVLGTPQSEDVRCVHFPANPEYMVHASVTDDGRYLVVEVNKGCDPTNQLFYYDLANQPIEGTVFNEWLYGVSVLCLV
jgi:prolyl oligopeptidase